MYFIIYGITFKIINNVLGGTFWKAPGLLLVVLPTEGITLNNVTVKRLEPDNLVMD